MRRLSKVLSITLAAAMVLSSAVVCGDNNKAEAAAKTKLKTKKSISLKVGKTATIKFKKKIKNAKYKYTSNKKAVAAVSKKGVITAKKEGSAVITVKETIKKKTSKVGTIKVTVTGKSVNTPSPADVTAAPTQATATTVPAQTTASAATATPEPAATATVTPTDTPKPESDFLPLDEFIEDTNYNTPANYDARSNEVDEHIDKISYTSTVIQGKDKVIRYANVLLPKDYDPEDTDKRYPVIYMNHGIFGNEDSLIGDRVQDVIWNAVEKGEAEEAIVVFPNGCANETGGSVGDNGGHNPEHYGAYNNFLNDFKECLKPYIDKKYNTLTDRENTAICGFSMGGRVSLHLGFTLQDTFRYVGAFCPAPGIFDYEDKNAGPAGYVGEGLFKEEEFKIKDEYKDDTLVLIVQGNNDNVVGENPTTYHNALVENEVPHIYFRADGGHSATAYKKGIYNFIRRIFKKK